jgi:hypothetical protein
MKTATLGLFPLLFCLNIHAQTFDEWFRQNHTQLKYSRRQIAALQAYIAVTEKGYALVQAYAQAIAAIKKGDLDLHGNYFASLKTVKPAIPNLAAQITDLNQRILGVARWCKGRSPAGDAFFQGLVTACATDISWLNTLTTDNQVQLKDEQRLEAIETLCRRMRQRLTDALTARNIIIQIQVNAGS